MAFQPQGYPRPLGSEGREHQHQHQHQPPQHFANHHHNTLPAPAPPPPTLPPPPTMPHPTRDELHRRPQMDLSDALSYFDLIKTHYSDFPDVYVRFLDVLTDFKNRTNDTPGIVASIAKLFADSRELLEHLNDFLPPGYFVERGDPDSNVVRLTIPGHGRQIRKPSHWSERNPPSSGGSNGGGGGWYSQVTANRWRGENGLPWSPTAGPEPELDHRSIAAVIANEDTSGLHLLGDLATRPSITSAAREALRAKQLHDAQHANHPGAWPGSENQLGIKIDYDAMDVDERNHHALYYNSHYAHDGYGRHDSTASGTTSDFDKNSEPHSPDFGRSRPRPTSTSSLASPRLQTKINKRQPRKRSLSGASKNGPNKPSAYVQQNSSRAFTCPFSIYGCTSTFGSKNEWKRHINTAHMRLGFWRCDITPCDLSERKPNDFNRKDLFIQHVRRMHSAEKDGQPPHQPPLSKAAAAKDPEEQALNAAAARCYRHLRSTPEHSGCLFCEAKFSGEGSWDERLEHVGRHMENAKKEGDDLIGPERWLKDLAMEDWLAREGLIVKNPDREGWTLHEGANVN